MDNYGNPVANTCKKWVHNFKDKSLLERLCILVKLLLQQCKRGMTNTYFIGLEEDLSFFRG